MSALAHKLPHRQLHRPHLRLVEAPQAPAVRTNIYRRRRIVAAIVVTALVLATASLVNSGLSWAWGEVASRATASAAPAGAEPTKPATEWTVRPGDTLWGIARAVQPTGDIRPLVDRLTEKYEGVALHPGQTIAIP